MFYSYCVVFYSRDRNVLYVWCLCFKFLFLVLVFGCICFLYCVFFGIFVSSLFDWYVIRKKWMNSLWFFVFYVEWIEFLICNYW